MFARALCVCLLLCAYVYTQKKTCGIKSFFAIRCGLAKKKHPYAFLDALDIIKRFYSFFYSSNYTFPLSRPNKFLGMTSRLNCYASHEFSTISSGGCIGKSHLGIFFAIVQSFSPTFLLSTVQAFDVKKTNSICILLSYY